MPRRMQWIRLATSVALAVAGVTLGFYVGFWVLLCGGVLDIYRAVKAPEPNETQILWGIGKIAVASPAGYLAATLVVLPIHALLKR
jgi:hypothetical protein